MSTKLFLFTGLIGSIVFLSNCGPAAEDRSNMVARSKIVQDSIANSIRMAMAEAEGPAPAPAVVVAPSATPAASNSPAPQQ